MRKISLQFIAVILSGTLFASEDLKPSVILKTDNYLTHHVIVAEKSTHKLYLFENDQGNSKLVKTYQMATGKKAGDKYFQGDHRTPEGIYEFSDFLTHEDLINRHGEEGKIYGVGAFVMNYPNPMDERKSKTGSGIWLHSTNDETRIEKGLDSRGCIVTANKHLIDIARYIELNKTAIVVVHEMSYLNKDAWILKYNNINDTVQGWRDAWANEDLNKYISYYHPQEFRDDNRGGINGFKAYKRAVFNNPGAPEIRMENISILQAGDYALVTFVQEYKSNTIEDTGKKKLYLKQDEFYNWKIVGEYWTKNGIDEEKTPEAAISFQPSMRFFKSTKIEDYLEVKGAN